MFKRNKYHVAPKELRIWRGKLYASKTEMKYAQVLWTDKALRGGSTTIIIEQPRLWLGVVENVYVPDFFVLDNNGPRFIDVKGEETPAFKKVRRLWAAYGMGNLDIVKKKGNEWTHEIIAGPPQFVAGMLGTLGLPF